LYALQKDRKVRITKEKKKENHERIVAIASQLFRERGFDGVGVAELMDHAGLTHGGFYNHFGSKEDLIAEASKKGFDETLERYVGLDAIAALELYISREHRDMRGQGCPAAALSCEAARQPEETRLAFGAGIESLVQALEQGLRTQQAQSSNLRAQAISNLAQAVGAIVLSRACPDDATLADEILDACRANCRDAIENPARAH
jgi:TetR/AcrR family transcriptional repressor of nem operon